MPRRRSRVRIPSPAWNCKNQPIFGWFFLFNLVKSAQVRFPVPETYVPQRSESDSIEKQVYSPRESQHTSFFQKTTFSLRFMACALFCPMNKMGRQLSPFACDPQHFVRWTIRKTTFSLHARGREVLSGGQYGRRHSPFTFMLKTFCPLDNKFSGIGGLQ